MPDFSVRFELDKPTTLTLDGHRWGEFKALALFSKENWKGQFSMIYRVTNHGGKILVVSARIMKEHPDIRQIVRELLDAIRLDN